MEIFFILPSLKELCLSKRGATTLTAHPYIPPGPVYLVKLFWHTKKLKLYKINLYMACAFIAVCFYDSSLNPSKTNRVKKLTIIKIIYISVNLI